MFLRRLLFRWRLWLLERRYPRGTHLRVDHHLLADYATLLDDGDFLTYQPTKGLTVVIHSNCRHLGELVGRLDVATLTIRDGEYVSPSRNRFGEIRRQRLDDYLVDDQDRPLSIKETIILLKDYTQKYHEALGAVTDDSKFVYYQRQYSRLNEEVLKLIDALLKVNDHVRQRRPS